MEQPYAEHQKWQETQQHINAVSKPAQIQDKIDSIQALINNGWTVKMVAKLAGVKSAVLKKYLKMAQNQAS